MLPIRVARSRLGRAFTKPNFASPAKLYSTKKPSTNTIRYTVAVAGVVSTGGLWWIWDTAQDDVPCLAVPPGEDMGIEPGPTKDQVTQIISKEAYSFHVSDVTGVDRYDGTQLASNSPCEDRFTHGKITSPWNDGNHWMAWAIFDGHSGWHTAELLKRQLLPFVQRSLSEVNIPPDRKSMPEEAVQHAIIQGFLNLDKSILETALNAKRSKEPLQDRVKRVFPAFAGSCALLSLYDPATSTLHVACTGDSRAILGQKRSDGEWEAIPLSVDQTGYNKEEVSRLYSEHPGEEDIVKNGRVLGMMVSRAFGDGQWKWPIELQQDMRQRFYGPAPLTPKYDIRTPPYLTAEPVVVSTKIDPSKPSFLIMATDGLWDMLSSQQAVALVGEWLESSQTTAKHITRPSNKPKSSRAVSDDDEPFDFGHFWRGVSWKFVDGRTTIEDDNSAVHLVRNALGGNHHELIAGRLAFGFPQSRRLRDDITVQVVFFNIPGVKR